MIELNIKIKGDDQTLSKRFLVYENIVLSNENELLQKLVTDTMKDFHGDVDDVSLTAKMVW
jgi:hypothetical protein